MTIKFISPSIYKYLTISIGHIRLILVFSDRLIQAFKINQIYLVVPVHHFPPF